MITTGQALPSVAATVAGRRDPPGNAARVLDLVLIYGLTGLLVFGPLAFGAVEEWSTFTLQAGVALLLVVWAARQVVAGSLEIAPNSLYLPMVAFGLLVLLQLGLGLSAYPYVTKVELLKHAAYGGIFLLAVHCLQDSRRLRLFLVALAVFGFVLAVFAIVQDLTSNEKIYWLRKPRFGGWVFGPYVNHNHYAGLMEMLIPVPLVLALRSVKRRDLAALLWFAVLIMTLSLLMSQSRGGLIALLFQILVLALFLRRGLRRQTWLVMGVLVLAVVFLFWLGSAEIFGRFDDLSDPTRAHVLKDSVRMVSERPWLGWGLGAFPTVYPGFRSYYTNKFVNQAHNDLLQVLIETGILGFSLMVWFLVGLYRTGLPRAANWGRDLHAAGALIGLLGCTGILIHSTLDFNLHIPANAAFFYAACALVSARGGEAGSSPT